MYEQTVNTWYERYIPIAGIGSDNYYKCCQAVRVGKHR